VYINVDISCGTGGIHVAVFWVMTPCGDVVGYQRSEVNGT